MRILIVKTSSMGDVVHALPLAADIARHVPRAQIDWVVEESFAAIPTMSRHVANVRRVALRRWRQQPLAASTWHEMAEAKFTLRAQAYDRVLDVQGLLKSAWISRWTGAPIAGLASTSAREQIAALFYTHRFDIRRALPAVERCRQLGALALRYAIDDAPRFDLVAPPAPGAVPDAPTAVLLTNASRPSKLWPEPHWLEVEQWLANQGHRSLLFAGNADDERRARGLAERMQRAELAPRASIDSIASALTHAQIVIGLDTGLSHLAAALGRPTVGIYCDYDPRLVGLVGSGPVASLGGVGQQPTAEAVIGAAQGVLERAQ